VNREVDAASVEDRRRQPDEQGKLGANAEACITEKAAIFVLPLEVALGRVGDDYVKGWEESDESRIDDSTGPADKMESDPLEYLNDGDLNDD
jgi:ferredoxin-type protein NapG